MAQQLEIRECFTLSEFADCIDLQREVFELPDIELSPVRHLVVTRNAGGFVLGAYVDGRLAGFCLSVPAFLRGEKAFYSHMTGVRAEYQSLGLGAKLKWAQRDRALELGVRFVKWTFEPWKARNAYFNLEKLGAEVREYESDFYGIDHTTAERAGIASGLASDRLFAEWDLKSKKVETLAAGGTYIETLEAAAEIEIPNDWSAFLAETPEQALAEQARIRGDFEAAFARGLVGRGFRRDDMHPKYLLY